jgi:hypothetical protein
MRNSHLCIALPQELYKAGNQDVIGARPLTHAPLLLDELQRTLTKRPRPAPAVTVQCTANVPLLQLFSGRCCAAWSSC